jgi:hypothetical protein
MTTAEAIDRLAEEGAQFSIAMGPHGYIVRLGNYAHEVTPQIETETLGEAVQWLRAHVALERGLQR